jgi:hypothetical protein
MRPREELHISYPRIMTWPYIQHLAIVAVRVIPNRTLRFRGLSVDPPVSPETPTVSLARCLWPGSCNRPLTIVASRGHHSLERLSIALLMPTGRRNDG